MKKQWTEDVGIFLARLSKMYSVVSSSYSSMGIGANIIPWLETESGKKELEAALKLLGAKFIESLSVSCSGHFNLAEFPGKDWATWKGPIDGDGLLGEEYVDCRSFELTEIKVSSLIFETCLDGEKQIYGQIFGYDKFGELRKKQDTILLGGNVFLGLWRDYQINKKNSILELLWHAKKIGYLDFFGLVLRAPGGRCGVLNLTRQENGEWKRGWSWFTWVWASKSFSAVYKIAA
ncbi:MAG: hypothetical protein UR66_C0021G0003 [Candidatus Moranbacteria bacterium GW2011_GWE1_35_17]|nr:MAG: hypothetical protein UR66_C0021G0003 [Candidatus Moranbacteria bacterium GW2011_GWE1_35_17]